jgi:hypothetical protein
MKTKETYLTPDIVLIALDNNISLQLHSDNSPMEEPTDWSYNQFNNLSKDMIA